MFVQLNGKGREPMMPRSQNVLSRPLGTMQFVTDDAGNVTHVIARADVAAIVAEEPATTMFTGMLTRRPTGSGL